MCDNLEKKRQRKGQRHWREKALESDWGIVEAWIDNIITGKLK